MKKFIRICNGCNKELNYISLKAKILATFNDNNCYGCSNINNLGLKINKENE